ncbi:hypothetical protein [Shinella sumterensis]|uniref:hypothetical protein n=1 Tax=Shinella sumterensis TaxID=1967501 RepID=UPI00106E1A89|nr:hypothetical protein [Shinella sumterensis]MCD1264698.1 hypothetical protein [Shinella sumterensis]
MIGPGMTPKDQVTGNGDRWNSEWRTPPPSAPSIDWQHSSSQLPININDARWISSPSGRYSFELPVISKIHIPWPWRRRRLSSERCASPLAIRAGLFRICIANVYQCGEAAFFGQNFVKISA